MTPKEKAGDLIKEYRQLEINGRGQIKVAALIAVDEIIQSHQMSVTCEDIVVEYWKEVREELENL